jgi:hypothetical protein
MRIWTVLLITACIGLVAATPASAKPRLCDQRAGETVAATEVVRVFRDTAPREPVLRGCRHGSRTTLRLAVDGDCMDGGDVGPIAAAGRYVAVTRISCDLVTGDATVVLFDLRRMRDVLGATAFTGARPPERSTSVAELALSRAGALAWLGRLDGGAVELHLRRPFSATPEVIATAEAIDISDIAVTAHKLFWVQNGKAQGIDL